MSEPTDSEPSSPACAMRNADDSYMGYASRAELAAELNELLAPERNAISKLESLLPRVRDDTLYADLRAILQAHQRNIGVLTALLGRMAKD